MKLWLIEPATMELTGDKIVVSSPRLGRRLRVGAHVAELLLSARSGVEADPDDAAVAKLMDTGFLVREESRPAAMPSPWREWGVAAWSFHAGTRDVPFVVADSQRLAAYREGLARKTRPRVRRQPVSDRILLLPRVRCPISLSFREVLEGRRTHRRFSGREVGLDAFADLLHYSFGPLRFADAGEMGVLQLRAAAAGGARHETEAFVSVFDVAGVEPGLYHYDGIRHGLVPLPGLAGRDVLEHLTHGQGFFREAGFGVLVVAVAERLSWKYTNPNAYRILLHDVGHVAQVFSMTATALGLGAALTAALRNSEADRLLGLDQPGEFTTFALACGWPAPSTGGLARGVRPAVATEDY